MGGADSRGRAAAGPTLLHRALKLQPLHQGALDGLCGLYAVINAMRLALERDRPLSASEARALFDEGIKMLVKRGRLPSAVLDGIPGDNWRQLQTTLAASASAVTGQSIVLSCPFNRRSRVARRDLLDAIDTAVLARQPVMAHLAGKHDHYTVICGATARRFHLFDSGSLYWLTRDLCGASPGRRNWPHAIDAASLTIVAVASPNAA